MSVGSGVSAQTELVPGNSAAGTDEPDQNWQAQLETFVGREREMQTLCRRIDDAINGRGSLVLVSGEPGIGKTRLLTEASKYAESKQMTVLWGRCDDSGAPAFWPWTQVFRCLYEAIPANSESGSLIEFATLMRPRCREDNLTDPPGQPKWADDYSPASRFHLFDSLTTALRETARKQPIAIFLDDLHEGDSDSLAVIEFLARGLDRTHLTINAAYRSEEVSLRPEFESFLLPIVRNCNPTRVSLSGLDIRDSEKLVAHHVPTNPTPESLKLLHERTAGNPFFIVETCKFESTREPLDGEAPAATIRCLIRARLTRLSEEGRRLLEAAAVLGTKFDSRVAGAMLGLEPHERDDLIDEIASHGVIERESTFGLKARFTHSLLRDAVYFEIPRKRRRNLHRRVVEALEKTQSNADGAHHLLAHHSFLAHEQFELQRTLDFLVAAGQYALSEMAYEKASLHFQRALQRWPEGGDLENRCDIHLLLGEAQIKAGLWTQARSTFESVLKTARRICSPTRLAAAAIGLKGMTRGTLPPDWNAISSLREALAVVPPEQLQLKATLLTALSTALYFAPQNNEAVNLAKEALKTARLSGDPLTVGDAIEAQAFSEFRYDRVNEMLSRCNELESLGRQLGNHDFVFRAKILKYTGLSQKNDPSARQELSSCDALADSLRHPRYRWQVLLANASLSLSRGEIQRSTQLCQQTREHGARYHDPTSIQHLLMLQFTESRLRQEHSEVLPLLERMIAVAPEYPLPRAGLAFIQAALGRRSQAEFTLAPIVANGLRAITPDGFALATLCILADTTRFLGPSSWLDRLIERLQPFEDDSAVVGWGTAIEGSVAHFLGVAQSMRGDKEEARRLINKAVETNSKAGYDILAARSRLMLAHVLHALGQHAEEQRAFETAANTYASAGLIAPTSGALCADRRNLPSPSRSSITSQQIVPGPINRFELCGEYWVISYAAREIRLRDCKGLRHLKELIQLQGQDIPSVDLAHPGRQQTSNAAIGEDASDRQSIAEYRNRLADIRAELAEAEDNSDLGRIDRLNWERAKIETHLTRQSGLFGRTRQTSSHSERARVNVKNALTAAIRRISKSHEPLGLHLDRSIKTGRLCTYTPEKYTHWNVLV